MDTTPLRRQERVRKNAGGGSISLPDPPPLPGLRLEVVLLPPHHHHLVGMTVSSVPNRFCSPQIARHRTLNDLYAVQRQAPAPTPARHRSCPHESCPHVRHGGAAAAHSAGGCKPVEMPPVPLKRRGDWLSQHRRRVRLRGGGGGVALPPKIFAWRGRGSGRPFPPPPPFLLFRCRRCRLMMYLPFASFRSCDPLSL